MINLIIILICSSFTMPGGADSVQIKSTSYSYTDLLNHSRYVDDYIIENKSDSSYLTWVSNTPVDGREKELMARRLVFQIHGDFNLSQLVYENLLNGFDPVIGASFVKVIPPNGSFVYHLVKNDKKSLYYQERIVVIRCDIVQKYLAYTIDSIDFFHPSNIVLIESPLME